MDHQAPRADDFQDYLFAAQQIGSGRDPYADFERTHVPWDWTLSSGYIYPPAFAGALVPLTWIPTDLAVRLWLVLLQAMVVASLLIVYRAIGRPGRGELLCMAAVTTTFFPLAANLYAGAVNPALLVLLTAAWAAWRRHRDVGSGALLAAAAVIKIIPVALMPYLAARRHWRLLATFVLTGLAGLALGFVVTSTSHNLHYLLDVVPHLSAGTGYRENQSLTGLAIRLCDPATSDRGGTAGWCGRALAWPAVAAVLALVMLATRRGPRTDLNFGLAVTALPLVSSVTWSFHLILLLLPIALLVRHVFAAGQTGTGRLAALALAWGCLALAPPMHFAIVLHPLPNGSGLLDLGVRALTRILGEAQLAGTVILFGVLWRILRGEPARAPSLGPR